MPNKKSPGMHDSMPGDFCIVMKSGVVARIWREFFPAAVREIDDPDADDDHNDPVYGVLDVTAHKAAREHVNPLQAPNQANQ